MAVIETLNLISKTMDDLIDFAVNDEYLSKEFEKFDFKDITVIKE